MTWHTSHSVSMPSWPSVSTNEVFVEKTTTKTNRNAKKQRDNDDFIVGLLLGV